MAENQRTLWRRLMRNKGALCGLLFIIACFLIAVFAYFISPDGSPNANRIIVEIGGQKPGFTQQFLKLPKQNKLAPQSFFDILMNGRRDRYDFVPINDYQW